jgi:hypothetical protein
MLFLFLIFVPSGWSFLAQSLLLAVPSVPLQLAFAGPVEFLPFVSNRLQLECLGRLERPQFQFPLRVELTEGEG